MRGQINSIDMVVSFILVIIVITFTTVFWMNGAASSINSASRMRLTTSLFSASDLLLKSPGVPNIWEQNTSNIKSIGLSSQSSQNVLSASKIDNFTSLPYSTIQSLLGMSGHEFYFLIEDTNGNQLYSVGNNTISGDRSVSITRYAILNNQIVRARFVAHE